MPPLILLHLPLGLPLLLSEKGVNILWFHRQCDAVGEVPPQFRRVTRVGRVVMLGQTTVEESQGGLSLRMAAAAVCLSKMNQSTVSNTLEGRRREEISHKHMYLYYAQKLA